MTGFDFYAEPPELDFRIVSPRSGEAGFAEASSVLETIQVAYGHQSGSSLLDVGCSSGEFLVHAMSQGVRCEGVELNPRLAELARERTGAAIYQGDMGEIAVPGGFDVVNCTEVLEHILGPHAFVQSIYRALRPGGMLHLTTQPNTSSFRSRFLKCQNGMIRNVFSHHVLYNPSAVEHLLKNHGFRNIRFHHYANKGRSWKIRALMRCANLFGYFDDQVIVTARKQVSTQV